MARQRCPHANTSRSSSCSSELDELRAEREPFGERCGIEPGAMAGTQRVGQRCGVTDGSSEGDRRVGHLRCRDRTSPRSMSATARRARSMVTTAPVLGQGADRLFHQRLVERFADAACPRAVRPVPAQPAASWSLEPLVVASRTAAA